MKNKLEKLFSKSLNADDAIWGMKLHNNMLAHQTTPADYIINLEADFGELELQLKSCLVECKQVTCDENGKGRLTFKRLKQTHDLLYFADRFINHQAYYCITFKEKFWKKSDLYIIPIKFFVQTIKKVMNKSLNRQDFYNLFKKHKIEMEKPLIPIREVLESDPESCYY
jgi:hypothetical protein